MHVDDNCSVFRNNVPVPTRGKSIFRYISLDSHYKDLTTLCRNVTKSQPPQSNSRNALPGSNNSSSSNSSQLAVTSTKKSVPASRVSGTGTGTSAKSRTTSVNGVAVTRSDNTGSNSKSKKPTNLKKSRVIEISDPEDSDSDSLEREAALASPAKGAESRKASTKVSKKFIYVR
jgi:hypothetical protein